MKNLRKAIKTVFPSADLRGCFYHFTHCIGRKTQSLRLAVPYKGDQDIKRFIRQAAVLPLVPIRHVEDVWFNAEDHHLYVTRFADYVTDYWIENNEPAEWNHFITDGPRTTNNIEGWHSRINKKLTNGHFRRSKQSQRPIEYRYQQAEPESNRGGSSNGSTKD